jgi:peptidoglycan biosynthesis protein MviN/MurJ (putative lipid II flippase)
MALISRILGFVQDMLIARIFGVDIATDAFIVAFKIPNFLRRLFVEGAFAHAFVPVLSDYRTHRRYFNIRNLALMTFILNLTVEPRKTRSSRRVSKCYQRIHRHPKGEGFYTHNLP